MKVKEIMKKDVITVKRGASYKEVARILTENKISGAPVVDEEDIIVGVVSEKDLFRVAYPEYREFYESSDLDVDFKKLGTGAEVNEKKVDDFMSKRLVTAAPDTPILKIGALMVAKGIHRVPVVEGGKVVGIVSRRDIYRAILREKLGA